MAALNLGQNRAAPQDPGPGTANKGHDQFVLGKGTFSMEPLAQLRSQGLSPGILLGPTLPGPPTAPRVPPQTLCGSRMPPLSSSSDQLGVFHGPVPLLTGSRSSAHSQSVARELYPPSSLSVTHPGQSSLTIPSEAAPITALRHTLELL